MASRVPKFGNWEGGNDAPSYTQYFDVARGNRNGGKPFNPNDPEENPDAFSGDVRPVQASPIREISEKEETKIKEQHHKGTEDQPRVTTRKSYESERSIENSPLHPHYQVKSANKMSTGSSPANDRRAAPEGSNTPGRFRMRLTEQDNEIPEKGSMIPKFGEWDESDPSAADAYTDVFKKVREEKKSNKKAPIIKTDPDFSIDFVDNKKKKSSFTCCGLFKN